jgi:hypothetical protein
MPRTSVETCPGSEGWVVSADRNQRQGWCLHCGKPHVAQAQARNGYVRLPVHVRGMKAEDPTEEAFKEQRPEEFASWVVTGSELGAWEILTNDD